MRSIFWSVAIISCVLNVLMLTGPLFMLQVYDRVLASRSVPTLVALSVLAAALYAFWGVFEFLRSRVLSRAAFWFDQQLGPPVFRHWVGRSSYGVRDGARPLQDIATLRQFLSSPALSGLFDVPWIPLYLAFVFIVHASLGWLTLGGAVLVLLLALVNESLTRTPITEASSQEVVETQFADQSHRNAESILPMGMLGSVERHWHRLHGDSAAAMQRAIERGELFSALSKALRMLLQSAVLALGAYLAVQQDISAGMIVAVSIIAGRALAPIDQVITHWRTVVRARQAYRRLGMALGAGEPEPPLKLPAPRGFLSVRNVSKLEPDTGDASIEGRPIILRNISFDLEPGDALGVIGPSASGKTTLARILAGAWPADGGQVRLDGALLQQWDSDLLGRYIGYLPQKTELLAGTVKQNIARFDASASDEEIVAAASLAGVHDMILRMRDGYDTRIGTGGASPLSGGQIQRIALARAVFRMPKLVVLDEPNSNLDAEGDMALAAAIEKLRKSGAAVVVMAHRPSAIAAVNKVLMLVGGTAADYGAKEEVLRRVTRPVAGGVVA